MLSMVTKLRCSRHRFINVALVGGGHPHINKTNSINSANIIELRRHRLGGTSYPIARQSSLYTTAAAYPDTTTNKNDIADEKKKIMKKKKKTSATKIKKRAVASRSTMLSKDEPATGTIANVNSNSVVDDDKEHNDDDHNDDEDDFGGYQQPKQVQSRERKRTGRSEEKWMNALSNMTDLRKPHTWFPLARARGPRSIILHVGPTNSGKTHSALEALRNAKSGLYCGPLRLLAQEVHQKMVDRGVACNLVTGQKIVQIPGAEHTSCTVEMADLTHRVDVAVIDEYQMLGDESRGWAWSRALLGVPAREIHLCGDTSAELLVREMLRDTGDVITVKRYERLSPLKPLSTALGHSGGGDRRARHSSGGIYRELVPGDCIVAFSRRNLYEIKSRVESLTKHRCCVVYGNLPPDTRQEQAALFNDPSSGHTILIATDAIGMGLNLNIGRIIFSTIEKFDGQSTRELTVSEIKQIGGRAGRFNSQFPTGYVTAFQQHAIPIIKAALEAPLSPSSVDSAPSEGDGGSDHQRGRNNNNSSSRNRIRAGLFPLLEQILHFDESLGGQATYSQILDAFVETARVDPNYFMCNFDTVQFVAQVIERYPMEMRDRYTFSMAPIDTDNPIVLSYLKRFASQFSRGMDVVSPSIRAILRHRTPQIAHLETVHKVLELYIWFDCHAHFGRPGCMW
jgi:ATP-dependent RNA helicase SUPV3L1/SUV3